MYGTCIHYISSRFVFVWWYLYALCIMLVQFSVESTGSILLMCMHYVIWIMCMHLSCLVSSCLVYLEISTVYYYYIYYYTNS